MKGTLTLSNDWDTRFLDLAEHISEWSKDPSKKIGAVAVGAQRQILAQGYNGFPRGIDDTTDRYDNREEKYKLVVHAEMNVIYNASYNGVSLNGSTLYVHGLPVCSDCAKGIIQVGIKRVVMNKAEGEPFGVPLRWKKSWENTQQMFKESGVSYDFASTRKTHGIHDTEIA